MIKQQDNDLIYKIRQKIPPIQIQNEPAISSNGSQAAAVLVPLTFQADELVMLFTHRSNTIIRHRGQVSFPGGMEETLDKSYLDTALRETSEEIGILPTQIEVFGRLAALASPSGYLIHPFVGFIRDLNGLQKNNREVEKIFCIPVKWLMSAGNLSQVDYRASDGVLHKVWTFAEYQGEKVWGITAEITRLFIETIRS